MIHFIPFARIKDGDVPDIGRKAFNLAWLKNKGFSVPDGFSLPAIEYTKAIEAYLLSSNFQACPSTVQRSMLEDIRRAIMDYGMEKGLGEEIGEIASSRTGLWVVRSSGIDEDGSLYSYAGVHRSISGCADAPQIMRAIGEVWASLWSQEAFVYREERGISHNSIKMGVILQQQIMARVSGVAFTRHPLSGADEIIINAHEGEGEALMSGRTIPFTLQCRVNRDKGEILEQREEGGVFPLDGSTFQDLIGEVIRMETLLGYPLDIEWIYDGTLHIVQCRPLCGALSWTREPIRDFVPDMLTPFSADFFKAYLEERFRELYQELGFGLPPIPLFHSHRGRIYMSKNITDLIVNRLQSGQAQEEHFKHAMELLTKLPEKTRAYYEHLEALLGGKRDESGWDRLQILRELLYREDYIIAVTYLYGYLLEYLDTAMPEELSRYKSRFRSLSSHDSESFSFQKDVEALAKSMEHDESLRDFLKDPDQTPIPPGLKPFIEKYGHWTDSPLELGDRRCREGSDWLLGILRLLQENQHRSRWIFCSRLREEKRAEIPRILATLRGELSRIPGTAGNLYEIIRWILFLIDERERHKRLMLLATDELRQICLETGEMLTRKGILDDRESVFLLSLEEMQTVIGSDHFIEAWKKHLHEKKEEFERNRTLTYPEEFTGSIPQPLAQPAPAITGGEKIKGLPLSKGMITATARILITTDHMKSFKRGEILVVPACEPCWSALFPLASGFIAETGGLLSHAAILAREYNLPAISGIARATRRIPPGARVTLDANNGWIILEQ